MGFFMGGEGRNRASLVADDIDIMVVFTGDSSRLCHYLNTWFPLGLLAILLAIASSGHDIGGEIGAIFGARVGGMTAKRVEAAARMLPDSAPLIPMETQSPKNTGQTGLAGRRDIEPNPFADNLGDLVLLRQPCPQIIQNRFRG